MIGCRGGVLESERASVTFVPRKHPEHDLKLL